jgi:hypothetical protein
MYCRSSSNVILFLLEHKKVPLKWWMFTLVSGLLLELRRLTMDHEGSSWNYGVSPQSHGSSQWCKVISSWICLAHPGAIEGPSEAIEIHYGAVKAHPGTLEVHPVTVSDHPGTVEAHPSSIAAHPWTVKDQSWALEGHHGAVETLSGTVEAHLWQWWLMLELRKVIRELWISPKPSSWSNVAHPGLL